VGKKRDAKENVVEDLGVDGRITFVGNFLSSWRPTSFSRVNVFLRVGVFGGSFPVSH
jgi:hypothetical protein